MSSSTSSPATPQTARGAPPPSGGLAANISGVRGFCESADEGWEVSCSSLINRDFIPAAYAFLRQNRNQLEHSRLKLPDFHRLTRTCWCIIALRNIYRGK